MKRIVAIIVMILMSVPASALAGTVNVFQSGKTEEVAWLNGPMFTEYINLSLPAECLVKKAMMDVSSVYEANCSTYPENVQISLKGTPLWEFNGVDYGAFGRQSRMQGNQEITFKFNRTNAFGSTTVRLPKAASIRNATIQMSCSGPPGFAETTNFTNAKANYMLGEDVSDAGDVNGDGYEDILVSCSPQSTGLNLLGYVYLYFGGQNVNISADIILVSNVMDDYFGYSISDAGDINGDGFADVIVGAPMDSAGGGAFYGKSYIYFGGPKMNVPNVTLTGVRGDFFGGSVSTAGDVNGDGYDDVIVGADGGGGASGQKAYIYFGGPNMDNSYDVLLNGSHNNFGFSVSGDGDLNGDGHDDVIVGAPTDSTAGQMAGAVFVYYGGNKMNTTPDIKLYGEAANDWFGSSVSIAGDVNGDGVDEIVVGAPYSSQGGNNAGRAYIFYGGKVNSSADVIFTGESAQDQLGYSVSNAGDVDNDGYDDVIIGAPYYNSGDGRAYVHLGKESMDNDADAVFTGSLGSLELLGISVSRAGDINDDRCDELIIGAVGSNNMLGMALITIRQSDIGILSPCLTIGQSAIKNETGYFNRKNTTLDIVKPLTDYLRTAPQSGTDACGNSYIDVPIDLTAKSDGNITLSNLNISYVYKTTVLDFTGVMNDYISGHKGEKDAYGNITIPLKIRSGSPGKIRLSNLDIALDGPPRLLQNILDARLMEDSADPKLIDILSYFTDDFDNRAQLNLSIVSATNQSFMRIGIAGNQYLSADATAGPGNWTGVSSVIARCTDTQGHFTDSNEFKVIVYNKNDLPIIISTPPTSGCVGIEYLYQVVAVDGDNDSITYSLLKNPVNMTINSTSGLVKWSPPAGGPVEVIIQVSDGQESTTQRYIIVVPYRPPRLTNTTIPQAQTGVPFVYQIPAVSDDGLDLSFRLLDSIQGMTIDQTTGRITWTPAHAGDFPVSVEISTGKASMIYNFTITVVRTNHVPKFTSIPIRDAFVGFPYSYQAKATDEDQDALTYSLVDGTPSMSIDSSSGTVSWTPNATGNFKVKVKVSDGKGGETVQEFMITVNFRPRPKVEFSAPSEGQKLSGKFVVSGKSFNGTQDIEKVQCRVDSGDWEDATGNTTWTYNLDTTKLKNGKHTLQARAYDGTDYSDIVNRTISVDNQKVAGKGFIPGFGAALASLAVLPVAFMIRRRKVG